jgi:hypothetical protein
MNAGFCIAAVLEVVARVGCTTTRQPHAQRPRCPARWRLRAAGVGQGCRLTPPDRGPRSPGVRIGRPLRTRHTQGATARTPRPRPGEPRDHMGHQAPRVVGCGGAGRSADLPVVAVRARDPAKARLMLLAAGWISDAPSGPGLEFRWAAARPRRPVRRSFQVRSWLASVPASRLVVSRRQPSHHQLQTGCNRYRPCSAGG